jgi:altronate dehydratase
VLEGVTLERVSEEIIDLSIDVINGRKSKAELNRQGGILCLYATTPAF